MSRLTVQGQRESSPTAGKRQASAHATTPPMLQPYSLVRAIWKQRWAVLSIWVALTAATVALVLRLPRTYQAQAVLSAGTTGISKDLVTNTVPDEVMDRLERLKQQALSHDNMIDFMKRFGLHRGDLKSMPAERAVELMREDIEMKMDRGWGQAAANTFKITVQGKDPGAVMAGANHLAAFFVNENRRDRERQANAASEFFTKEMTAAKTQVEMSETRLNQFKSSFIGELPQQQEALLATLAQARTQLQGVQDALSRSAQNRLLLNNSLDLAHSAETATRRLLDQAVAARKKPAPITITSVAANAPNLTDVQRAEAELAGLRQRYGDVHPDVRRAKTHLEEAKIREAASAPPPAPNAGPGKPAVPPVEDQLALEGPESVLRQTLTIDHEKVETLKAQIKVAEQDDVKYNAERQRVLADIGAIEARIRNVPLREQQMSHVTRDYEMGKERYESMVDKKLAADLNSELERKKGAETFQLLDSARTPEEPIKPKRSILAMAGSIFGLLLGLVAAIALEMRNEVLLGEWELPPGTPVLGRIIEVRAGSRAPNRKAIA